MLSTYNVLALEFARAKRANRFEESIVETAPLHSVHWHRVALVF